LIPNSSVTPYLTPQQFLTRYDWRTIGQLCSDSSDPNNTYQSGPNTGQLVVTYENLTNTNEAFVDPPPYIYTNLITCLSDSCGELEAACLRSQIYQVTDLQTLANANPPLQASNYMLRIISWLTAKAVYSRRLGPNPPESVINDYNAAMTALEALSTGTRIFGFIQTETAGLPVTQQIQPYQYFQNNLISARWERSFGIRQAERRFF
jgi:hypothetical protein